MFIDFALYGFNYTIRVNIFEIETYHPALIIQGKTSSYSATSLNMKSGKSCIIDVQCSVIDKLMEDRKMMIKEFPKP